MLRKGGDSEGGDGTIGWRRECPISEIYYLENKLSAVIHHRYGDVVLFHVVEILAWSEIHCTAMFLAANGVFDKSEVMSPVVCCAPVTDRHRALLCFGNSEVLFLCKTIWLLSMAGTLEERGIPD